MFSMNNSTKLVLSHIIGWTFFLFLVFLLPIAPPKSIENESIGMGFKIVLGLMIFVLIGFYYLNANILFPKLFLKGKRVNYFFCVFAVLTLLFIIPVIVGAIIHPSQIGIDNHRPRPNFLLATLVMFFIIFIASSWPLLMKQWFLLEGKNKAIEYEKTVTELSLLKSQINPHFLFNTLNNIYTLAITNSTQTPEAILKLSKLMRYLMNNSQQKSVPLSKEIEHLSQYIDLQKLRITEKVTIDFIVEGDTSLKEIAPLILLPFVENAFKYGISAHNISTILIQIIIMDNLVSLKVINPIFRSNTILLEASGIGLANVKRRLDLLYENHHQLNITNDDDRFVVNLEIIC